MSDDKLKAKIVDAGISLAYSTKGAGIASIWAEHLRQHIAISEKVDTWAVDGEAVHINPKWTATLGGQKEIEFLIAHESLHIALDHIGMTRAVGADRDPAKADLLNIAQDAVINQALIDDGIGAMPTGQNAGVTFTQFVQKGYNGPRESLALYEWLLKNPAKSPSGGGGGSGQGKGKPQPGQGAGKPQPGQGQPSGGQGRALQGCAPKALPGQGQGDDAKAESDRRVKVERARATLREAAQKAGTGSAIADLLAPRPVKASVRQVIRQGFERASINAKNRTQPSYSRAGRRDYEGGIVTPGKIGTEARVAFIGDVSGSLGEEGACTLIGFIESTAREFPDVRVYLVTHTDEVVFADWLKAGGDRSTAAKAAGFTGGTDFAPAYEKVKSAGKFDVVVHFTDGYNGGDWPENPAKQLVIGLWGSGQGMTTPPPGAKCIEVASVTA